MFFGPCCYDNRLSVEVDSEMTDEDRERWEDDKVMMAGVRG